MIKAFAERPEFEIPENLKPFLISAIHGHTEDAIHLSFPNYPNGFPVFINVYGSYPILHLNGRVTRAPSTLNLAGQIYGEIPKIEIQGRFGQIGFLMHPTTPYYLFHLPGNLLLNSWSAIEEISPKNTTELFKALDSCQDPLHRLPILMHYLEQLIPCRLSPVPWLDQSLTEIYECDGLLSIKELSERAGLSLRHFRRLFIKIIGIPPKFFCKVVQLNTIFESINNANTEKIHHLAYDCGYYDQAHFINDFKKLIGDSPEKFLNSKYAYVKTYLGRKGS
ncbi:AraC family transcriptional regulator [Maribacter polysiphoniae]|uniref:AraC family transcriptional regulator n=1 Tax=Maribacter polysiphoniae TaxID=429344 RepID=A0A316DVT3_9FLAO|nr:AraC family transcriptional regulator [Maribacter polysiphoniae]MBD1262181.1 AraC family transcriptional regulator [Maribacter polysiphoniae]PWK21558.1 helix-turn-helix protein [Maribacter polysiphoniae]